MRYKTDLYTIVEQQSGTWLKFILEDSKNRLEGSVNF
jgi:hypothetical protein